MVGKVKITLIKSAIGKPEDQRRTLKALGLSKLNHSVEHEATPQIVGMINKVRHLLAVEELA